MKPKGFKIIRIKGYKAIQVNDGIMCEIDNIRTYLIDLKQKHCEIQFWINNDTICVKYPYDEKYGCQFKFEVPKNYQMLAEVNRYTLIVRMIPKIDFATQKFRLIERKGKSMDYILTRKTITH